MIIADIYQCLFMFGIMQTLHDEDKQSTVGKDKSKLKHQ